MTVGPDRRYVCPLCKVDDEDLDHFLQKCPVLLDLREICLHGINLMLPGILQNSNPTTIFRVGVYIDKSLIRRKSFIWLISFVVRLGTFCVEFCFFFLCVFVLLLISLVVCYLFIFLCVYGPRVFEIHYLSIYLSKRVERVEYLCFYGNRAEHLWKGRDDSTETLFIQSSQSESKVAVTFVARYLYVI